MIGFTVTPGECMSINRKLMPSLLFRFLAGAHEAEDPVGVLRERRPGLDAVDEEVVALVFRFRAQRREVGARTGFRITLTPPHIGVEDVRQKSALLFRPCRIS